MSLVPRLITREMFSNTERILLTVDSCFYSVDFGFQKPGDCYRGDISMCKDGDSSRASATGTLLALSQNMQRSHVQKQK